MNKYYEQLNDGQKMAVFSDSNRILCLAGAGTGKTKTMVTRVARLIEDGVDPENILMLTFTRAAAQEQKERLITMIGEQGSSVWASTFHSWAVREIRRYAKSAGVNRDFSIYDREDTESIISDVICDLGYKVTTKEVIAAIERFHTKNAPFPLTIKPIIDEYRFICKRQNAVDIDSLIPTLSFLLRKDTIHHTMQSTYKYVFVDEMQDTDQRQMDVLNALDPENLFVVGDDFQAIYGFRGADPSIIISLADDPAWQTIKLEENYRSTAEIVNPANALIKHNNQTEKILKAHRNGSEISCVELETPEEELQWIAGKCARLASEDGTYMGTCVLARTNKQVEAIADAMEREGIPHRIVRKSSEVLFTIDAKGIAAWTSIAVNRMDDEAARFAVNYPETLLSKKELLYVEMYQLEHECSLITAIEATGKAPAFIEMLEEIEDTEEASQTIERIIETIRVKEVYAEKHLENRVIRIQKIADSIRQWEEMRRTTGEDTSTISWLEFYKMRLIEPQDVEEPGDEVQIMTIHGSKGLEFDNVIIQGLNEKSLPLSRADVEEERRICYVAMTRAKNRLYMTRSKCRIIWGNKTELAEKSRFVEEL